MEPEDRELLQQAIDALKERDEQGAEEVAIAKALDAEPDYEHLAERVAKAEAGRGRMTLTERVRANGHEIRIVPGFRDAVMTALPSGTPKPDWTQADYATIAERRLHAARQRLAEIRAALGQTPDRGLELGCGAGLDALAAALGGVRSVVGIDRDPPLTERGERGEQARRLLAATLAQADHPGDPEQLIRELGVDVQRGDAASLSLPDASVDAVWSRTALEHMRPLDAVLAQSARVLREGGIAHHQIDPFFWLKGCHAGGLTDVPWAHARLHATDFRHAVCRAESRGRAERRAAFLATLNPLGLAGWRMAITAQSAFEVVSWDERRSAPAERLLAQHPDVEQTLLDGVTRSDLTCCAIVVVLRRRSDARRRGPMRNNPQPIGA